MVKGFGEVDLPDGMSQEQMRLALRQMYPTSARQSATDALTPIQTADTYEPTLSEMISSGIGETLYDTGIVSDRYRAMETGRSLGDIASYIPPVAAAIAGDAFGRELKQGDYLGAAGSAIEGALEVNPVGDAIGAGVGALASVVPVVAKKSKGLIDEITDRDLYKATNINERGLQTAEELGGMPAPSLAVASSKYPFENYGDISLVAQKDAFAKDPTFQADVYSPRFPKPDLTVPRSTVKAEEARLIDMVGEDYSPDIPSQLSSEDDLYNIPAYTAEFAKMKGIDIEPEVNSEKVDEFIDLFGSDIDSQLRGYNEVDDAFNDRAKKYLAQRMSEKTKPIDKAIAVVDDQDILESLKDRKQSILKRSQGYFTDGKLNEKGKRVIAQDYSKAKSDATFNPRFKRDELQKQIRDAGLIDEYNEFINQKMTDLDPNKTFFNQPKFQKTGDRQDLAYNMNNALKLMKSQPLRGGEGFSYGLGNVRAEVAPRLKNLSEIQDKRGLIVAQDEFMGEKDTFEQGMFDLYNDIDIDIGELDFAEDLADYAGGRDSYIKDLDPEDLAKVDDYLNSLQDMPTEYFEIKPMRKVDLNEFYGAVVPKGTSAKVKNQLESYGLKVVEYKDDRRDAIKELNKMSGGQIMFSAGGVGLITASQMDDEEAEL